MWGKLTIKAFEHNRIEMVVDGGMILVALLIIGLITYKRLWKRLWTGWFTSLDPKKIGAMYIIVAFVMLLKGLADASMIRIQQAYASGSEMGYLSPEHFQQIFSAHGTTMIFFVGMGVVFGSMNLVIPLQIGARDVAFPFLNAVSFWLFAVAALLVNISLIVGQFQAAGWLAYPPLSQLEYSPAVGVDYWIWLLQIAGAGSLLGGINFLTTIIKMRCPGMTMMKMPLFTWSCLGALMLICFAFPILTATLGMLSLDRYMGMHFFTASFGGNAMMYVNLIWAWGHPEVYILILPIFGIFSEVVATYSHKRLFGYGSMVWAIIAITFLSFIVWLHHFFTMGAGANVNAFFGIMTMVIAIPTGVKIFNWLFTEFRGRVHFATPMLWFTGFIIMFTIGGMAGVLMSVPPVDFQVHNSLFLIAHFHTMILPGVLFGFFAGCAYWFPKVTGFKLNERIGKYACFCWVIGFLLAFMPLYLLGLMGATRRLNHYDDVTGWQPLFVIAAFGVGFIVLGICLQILQLIVSYKQRFQNADTTGDPWNGRTLEWATASPPPSYNFAVIPRVQARDPFWEMKQSQTAPTESFIGFHMPKNTPLGLFIGLSSLLFGFSAVWHITWLALLGLLGVIVCIIVRIRAKETEIYVSSPR